MAKMIQLTAFVCVTGRIPDESLGWVIGDIVVLLVLASAYNISINFLTVASVRLRMAAYAMAQHFLDTPVISTLTAALSHWFPLR